MNSTPVRSSNGLHRGPRRVWFDYKGKLDCVKGDFDFVADLKQAIHKKLGKSHSATSLDLDLYLSCPTTASSPSSPHRPAPPPPPPTLRELRANMACSNCYGFDLFAADANSPDASFDGMPLVVVLSAPPAAVPTTPTSNSSAAAQQQQQLLALSGRSLATPELMGRGFVAQPQRPLSGSMNSVTSNFGGAGAAHDHFDLTAVGVVDDDEEVPYDEDERFRGGARALSASVNSVGPVVTRPSSMNTASHGGGGGGSSNPRAFRVSQTPRSSAAADSTSTAPNATVADTRVVCIGVDVVRSATTGGGDTHQAIVGSIVMELPVATVIAGSVSGECHQRQTGSSNSNNSTPLRLHFNTYILNCCRDAIARNVALSRSRATPPRLVRVMLYDSDFGEYVLYSDATNAMSFPVFASLDPSTGKFVGRPSIVAVVEYPSSGGGGHHHDAASPAADCVNGDIVVTSPLYVPASAQMHAHQVRSLSPSRQASAASTPAAASSATPRAIDTRPSSTMGFQPPPGPRLERPHSATVVSSSVAAANNSVAAAAALSSRQLVSAPGFQHQQSRGASGAPPQAPGASTSAALTAAAPATAACEADRPRRPWSASAATVTFSASNANSNNNNKAVVAPIVAPATTTAMAGAATRVRSPPQQKQQQQTFSAAATTTTTATHACQDSVDCLVNRLAALAGQLRDEKTRSRSLELAAAAAAAAHADELLRARAETALAERTEHESRLRDLNCQLDGEIQRLRSEVWTLNQRGLNGDGATAVEVADLRRRCAVSEAEVAGLAEKRDRLEELVESAVARYEELKKDRDERLAHIDALAMDKYQVELKLYEVQQSGHSLREATALRLKNAELEQSVSVLQRERNALHTEVKATLERSLVAERRAEDAEEQLDSFRRQWSHENEHKSKRIADLARSVMSSSAKQTAAVTTAAEALSSADATAREVDSLRQQLLELSLQLAAEKKRNASLVEQQTQWHIDESFRAKALDLTRQNMTLMQERDKLKQRLWEVEHNLRAVTTQGETTRALRELQELQPAVASSTARVLMEEMAQLQTQLSQSLDANLSSERAIAQLREEVASLQAALERARGAATESASSAGVAADAEAQSRLRQLRAEADARVAAEAARVEGDWRARHEVGVARHQAELEAAAARHRREVDALLARLSGMATASTPQQPELPQQSPPQTPTAFGADRRSAVVLKLTQALEKTARNDAKRSEEARRTLEVVKDREIAGLHDDVAASARETFEQSELVARHVVIGEQLRSAAELQKVFEDEVLQHIAGIKDRFGAEQSFFVDGEDDDDDDDFALMDNQQLADAAAKTALARNDSSFTLASEGSSLAIHPAPRPAPPPPAAAAAAGKQPPAPAPPPPAAARSKALQAADSSVFTLSDDSPTSAPLSAGDADPAAESFLLSTALPDDMAPAPVPRLAQSTSPATAAAATTAPKAPLQPVSSKSTLKSALKAALKSEPAVARDALAKSEDWMGLSTFTVENDVSMRQASIRRSRSVRIMTPTDAALSAPQGPGAGAGAATVTPVTAAAPQRSTAGSSPAAAGAGAEPPSSSVSRTESLMMEDSFMAGASVQFGNAAAIVASVNDDEISDYDWN